MVLGERGRDLTLTDYSVPDGMTPEQWLAQIEERARQGIGREINQTLFLLLEIQRQASVNDRLKARVGELEGIVNRKNNLTSDGSPWTDNEVLKQGCDPTHYKKCREFIPLTKEQIEWFDALAEAHWYREVCK